MDLLKPGLPKNVLRQARSTNTISFRLLEQIRNLNKKTNDFLATLGTDPATAQSTDGAETVAQIFTDFYYQLQINGDGKLTEVPEISISVLKSYQNRIEDATVATDFERGLVSLINEYSVILGLHHLANSILYRTIEQKSHVAYWKDVRLSWWGKVVYGVQTLPERTYGILLAGFSNAVKFTEKTNNQSRLARVWRPLTRSFQAVLCHSWLEINVNFIVKQSRLLFLRLPLRFLDEEIKGKLALLSLQLDENYKILGMFLNSLPVSSSNLGDVFPDDIAKLAQTVTLQLTYIDQFIAEENKPSKTSPPNVFVRYWPLLLITVNYGPSASSNVWKNRSEIAEWVRLNFVDTAIGFWSNWIIKPIGDMLSILRNDDTMAIALKESLQSDLDSLERMVMDYLTDTNVNANAETVRSAVRQGDLTMVMSQYEDELRRPYLAIIKGLLIRSILIQVQKTKVDGDLAISGIDKLLKLQQLLLGVLSILPSLFILYQANNALRKDAALTQTLIDRRVDCLRSLNHINRLVNRENTEDKFVSDGKLFVEVVNLNLLSQKIVPRTLRGDFLLDLNRLALASSDDQTEVKAAVNRIWNMYSPFFRQ